MKVEIEVVKLLAIMEESADQMVARSYVIEKLERILTGNGISLHPTLAETLPTYFKKYNIEEEENV